tara:strand:+ start:414 stop:587 length:174 start_codon:yes stop_codon:yes gene_type:complete
MARLIDYDTDENAHDDILNDKPGSGKMTTAQLQVKVAKLYDIVHDMLEFYHTERPDS